MTLFRKTALTLVVTTLTLGSSALAATPLMNDKGGVMQRISIVAGSGAYSEQDGSTISSSFRMPLGLAIGANDELYVSDSSSHKIRMLRGSEVSTYAGPSSMIRDSYGQPFGTLLNGQKENALFHSPSAIAYGDDGSLYVADSGNHAIRKIKASGEVVTLAGSGKIGSVDGKGNNAPFNHPQGIAVTKAGIVYVADTLNHVIRRIAPDGTTLTLTAPSDRVVEGFPGLALPSGDFEDGTINKALFNEPTGLALDSNENLYVSDTGNQRIRYIDFAANQVLTVAGGTRVTQKSVYEKNSLYVAGEYRDGAASHAAFNFPKGIALDANGGLIIADSQNNVIRYLSNGIVTTLAGNTEGEAGMWDGVETSSLFHSPQGIAVALEGSIYVADTGNNRIRKIEPYRLPAINPGNKEIKVVLEDEQIKFDVQSEMNNSRVMVPVRNIAESLGYLITFAENGQTVQLKKGNITIELHIGEKKIKRKTNDDVETTKITDVAPYVKNKRTYVPLRFFAEETGMDVQWAKEFKTAILRNK